MREDERKEKTHQCGAEEAEMGQKERLGQVCQDWGPPEDCLAEAHLPAVVFHLNSMGARSREKRGHLGGSMGGGPSEA